MLPGLAEADVAAMGSCYGEGVPAKIAAITASAMTA